MSSDSDKQQLELAIPPATSHQTCVRQVTQEQKDLIERKFGELANGQGKIEFETDVPLTPEICRALSSKGYSYSYSYVRNGHDKPQCKVTISPNAEDISFDSGSFGNEFKELRRLMERPFWRMPLLMW